MPTVKVYHAKEFYQPFTGNLSDYTHVATITMPEGSAQDPKEYAFRWTNNIDGSWSRGALIDGKDNLDFNEAVTVEAALPVENGRVYGLRSTSVHDLVEVEGQLFEVSSIGFKAVALSQPA